MLKAISMLLTASILAIASAQKMPDEAYLSLTEQSAWLLNNNRVINTLQLDGNQKREVDEAFSSYAAQQKTLFAHGAPSMKDMEKLDHVLAQRLLSSLNKDQTSKLEGMAVNLRGPKALADPSIANKLGLSASQRAAVQADMLAADKISENFDAGLATKLLQVSKTPAATYAKRRKAVIDAAQADRAAVAKSERAEEEKAVDVLTSEQKKAWLSMQSTRL